MKRTTSLVAALVAIGIAAPAYAHFTLMEPANWTTQGPLGDPQKEAPCGGETAPDNGSVTAYKVGDTVTVTIKEDVTHAGYYRVLLAANRGALPADPSVPGAGTDECGGLTPVTTPSLPLLADGQLMHSAAFSGPQSFQVTLPAGMSCDHCTLQVVEYMKNHAKPCFYHHCATVNISPNGTGGVDAGVNPNADGGTTGGGTSSGGCAATGGAFGGSFVLALAAAIGLRRRKR